MGGVCSGLPWFGDDDEDDYFMDARRDRSSIFYDAREFSSFSSLYFPTTVPNTHRRGTLVFEDLDTLLYTSDDNRESAAPRQTLWVRAVLQEPDVKLEVRGYPGDLTLKELEACLDFREILKGESRKKKMVECFEGVEEEPYALCRYLRGTDFNVEKALETLDKTAERWKKAEKNDFFPTIEEAVGCPPSVFFSQYPVTFHGIAKNGCPVCYLMAGKIQTEGIECVTTLDGVENFIWHSNMYQFKNYVAKAQTIQPDAVRCESVNIVDLRGIVSSQLNKNMMEAIQRTNDVSECFPEVLNRLVILNAPLFFSVSWSLIKKFLDPRIVNTIEIYTNEKRGRERMMQIISKDQLLSDYGGLGPSFESVSQRSETGATRTAFKLLTANQSAQSIVNLSANEKTTITVYSRLSGVVSLSKEGEVARKVELANEEPENREQSTPRRTEITSNESGPGEIQVSVESLTSPKVNFLIYAEVFPENSDR